MSRKPNFDGYIKRRKNISILKLKKHTIINSRLERRKEEDLCAESISSNVKDTTVSSTGSKQESSCKKSSKNDSKETKLLALREERDMSSDDSDRRLDTSDETGSGSPRKKHSKSPNRKRKHEKGESGVRQKSNNGTESSCSRSKSKKHKKKKALCKEKNESEYKQRKLDRESSSDDAFSLGGETGGRRSDSKYKRSHKHGKIKHKKKYGEKHGHKSHYKQHRGSKVKHNLERKLKLNRSRSKVKGEKKKEKCGYDVKDRNQEIESSRYETGDHKLLDDAKDKGNKKEVGMDVKSERLSRLDNSKKKRKSINPETEMKNSKSKDLSAEVIRSNVKDTTTSSVGIKQESSSHKSRENDSKETELLALREEKDMSSDDSDFKQDITGETGRDSPRKYHPKSPNRKRKHEKDDSSVRQESNICTENYDSHRPKHEKLKENVSFKEKTVSECKRRKLDKESSKDGYKQSKMDRQSDVYKERKEDKESSSDNSKERKVDRESSSHSFKERKVDSESCSENSKERKVDRESCSENSRERKVDREITSDNSKDSKVDRENRSDKSKERKVDRESWRGNSEERKVDRENWHGNSKESKVDRENRSDKSKERKVDVESCSDNSKERKVDRRSFDDDSKERKVDRQSNSDNSKERKVDRQSCSNNSEERKVDRQNCSDNSEERKVDWEKERKVDRESFGDDSKEKKVDRQSCSDNSKERKVHGEKERKVDRESNSDNSKERKIDWQSCSDNSKERKVDVEKERKVDRKSNSDNSKERKVDRQSCSDNSKERKVDWEKERKVDRQSCSDNSKGRKVDRESSSDNSLFSGGDSDGMQSNLKNKLKSHKHPEETKQELKNERCSDLNKNIKEGKVVVKLENPQTEKKNWRIGNPSIEHVFQAKPGLNYQMFREDSCSKVGNDTKVMSRSYNNTTTSKILYSATETEEEREIREITESYNQDSDWDSSEDNTPLKRRSSTLWNTKYQKSVYQKQNESPTSLPRSFDKTPKKISPIMWMSPNSNQRGFPWRSTEVSDRTGTRVANIRKKELMKLGIPDLVTWLKCPDNIYIGRNMEVYVPGAKTNKWGNPFSVKKFGRDGCIRKYEEHIRRTPALYNSLEELTGKCLGCWCHPEPCHGDVLVKLLNEKLHLKR